MGEVQDVIGPFIDAIVDPVILLDGQRVAAVNSAAAGLLGEHAVGRAADELLPRSVARAVEEGDRDAAVVASDLGGQRRHWEVRVGALADGRSLLHLIDRTAIEAVERMRVDFVANASHELRTPLAAITGFAETLADDAAGGDPDTRQRFVGIIAREAHRMQRLIEDLLSLSRIEADRYLAPSTLADLGAITRMAALTAAEQRMPRGEDLVLADIQRGVLVQGDPPQLGQLAHNLVSNAFKYGRPGTPVTVSVVRREACAELIVTDEGEGIPPKHLPRITQRFYRVNATRSRQVGGTGLGLAIVKHIVERHSGKLVIDSEVGRGTTVCVRLPLADAEADADPAPTARARHHIVTAAADGARVGAAP